MEPERTVQKSGGSGCGKAALIGCGGATVLLVALAVLGYLGLQRAIANMAEQYTATEAVAMPAVQASEDEVAAVLRRVEEFKKACREGRTPPALALTSQEINILVQNDPGWKELSGKVYVTIEGDRIRGQTSIPLDKLAEAFGPLTKGFKGRYLNGTGVFRIELVGGRLAIFVDSLEVRGKPLPDEFMKNMRAQNLAEEANKNPDTAAILEKLESVTVRNGVLQIVPRTAGP